MAGIKKKKPPKLPRMEEVVATGSKKNLLVGTIFCKDSALQRKWLDLQLEFLRKTTFNFDHVTVLYSEKDSQYFSDKTEVLKINPFATNSVAHVTGLQYLTEVFRSRRQLYDAFLFLDSDAFPIRQNWLPLLLNRMRNHSIAIPLRTENLETRIHACILFAKPEALDNLAFEAGPVGDDLVGDPEGDIHLPVFQRKLRKEVFTLVRSNKVNVHPVLCGIYYDCFYHHCCGSGRAFNIRSRDYWDHICNNEIDVNCYTQQLMSNPGEFVSNLAGWTQDIYAKV